VDGRAYLYIRYLEQTILVCFAYEPQRLRVSFVLFPVVYQQRTINVFEALLDFSPVDFVLVRQLFKHRA
jgi:hypothetical protein